MQPISDMLSYDRRKLLGQGSFGQVYSGLYNNLLPVAIKRIMKSHTGNLSLIQRKIDIMMKACNHPNIRRYFCTEENDDFLFIASELCAGTLHDMVKWNKIESGVERNILYQVACGLYYLHDLGIVHRNMKPTNIFFLNPLGGSRKLQVKITSYGISKFLRDNDEDFTNTSVTNPSGTRGWMAPETYESKRFDFKVDMFALGLIFAFTLSHGKHPFGEDPDLRTLRIRNKEKMSMTLNEFRAPYSNDRVAFELIQSMLTIDPAERPTVEYVLNHEFFVSFRVTPQVIHGHTVRQLGENLSIYPKKIIFSNKSVTVFVGNFKEHQVAVKRIMTSYDEVSNILKREVGSMKKLVHPNIVRYISFTTTDDFIYIAIELCKGTLNEWIGGTLEYDGPKMEDERKILHQVTQGLVYLHDNHIIHRDIKPHNILIHVMDGGREPQMKLADFGICSTLNVDNGFPNTSTTNPSGTRGYMAPEMYESKHLDNKVDIFALGCVFGCTLSNGGKHPFGDDEDNQAVRIKTKKPPVLTREQLKDEFSTNNEVAFQMIDSMVRVNPKDRPTAKEILANDFFIGL